MFAVMVYFCYAMKKLTLLSAAALLAFSASAQVEKTYKQKGYTLNFTNTDATLDSALQERMIKTIFEVYPKLAKE